MKSLIFITLWNSECNKLILVAPREWCDYLTDKRQDIPE